MTKKKMNGEKKMTKEKKMTRFFTICKMSQPRLKNYLSHVLNRKYGKENVINADGFLYTKGNDVLLTAHMDTTPTLEYGDRMPVKNIVVERHTINGKEKRIVSSPQGIGGDDRCGIYIILRILNDTEFRPSILFCEDEEIGCVGSSKFVESEYIDDLKEMKFLIELDRRGNNDLVFYDDDNKEFHKWCEKVTGYKEAYGSCSDISNLMPESNRSGVNLSCGYYDEHHVKETVVLEEMLHTLEVTKKLLKEAKSLSKPFEFVEFKWWEDKYNWRGFEEEWVEIGITYYDYKTKENKTVTMDGYNERDALLEFLIENPHVCYDDIKSWWMA